MHKRHLFYIQLVFCFLFVAHSSTAQFGFIYNDSIQVIKNNDTLAFPWAGGLNHVQISSIDVDFDGLEDLFVFDRSENQISIFKTVEENGVKRYEYLHNSEGLFPDDIRYRIALIDYNGDGKKDIFTYGSAGIKVFKNTGDSINGLQWELEKELLRSTYSDGNSGNLYVSSVDIPAYVDVDGDGDIDILTLDIAGQSVEYHKNLSMELYGVPDSLEFKLYNQCWGKFSESTTSNSIQLNSNVGYCGNGSIPNPQINARHSGSCLLALDLNGDDVMDLILGDVSHYNVTALYNGGTEPNQNSPMSHMDENFPSNTTSVNISTFPASFYVDVDHDGIKDLIVSTNMSGSSENTESVWFYKNIGTNSYPEFSFVQNNFLQDDMIENGKGSIPVLVDLDNDGLKDLLIASYYRYLDPFDKISKIQYYKNTGSIEKPEFTLMSDDWLSLSEEGYGLRLYPAFGDLNGNGKEEMILGRVNGLLQLYERTGNGPEDYILSQAEIKDHLGVPINVNNSASPQLFDLNNDGLLDLIIGKRAVGLTYYENIGTSSAPIFKWVTDNLGQINMGNIYYPHNYATPQFIRHNDTTHLFVGNRLGTIYYFNEIEGNIADGDSFNLLTEKYANIETGGFSAPFIDTLRNDKRYHMFVGTDQGGLWAYIADEFSVPILNLTKESKTNSVFDVYPNPSKSGVFTISTQHIKEELNVSVYNSVGQKIQEVITLGSAAQLDLSQSEQGVYILIIKNKNEIIATQRVISQH